MTPALTSSRLTSSALPRRSVWWRATPRSSWTTGTRWPPPSDSTAGSPQRASLLPHPALRPESSPRHLIQFSVDTSGEQSSAAPTSRGTRTLRPDGRLHCPVLPRSGVRSTHRPASKMRQDVGCNLELTGQTGRHHRRGKHDHHPLHEEARRQGRPVGRRRAGRIGTGFGHRPRLQPAAGPSRASRSAPSTRSRNHRASRSSLSRTSAKTSELQPEEPLDQPVCTTG